MFKYDAFWTSDTCIFSIVGSNETLALMCHLRDLVVWMYSFLHNCSIVLTYNSHLTSRACWSAVLKTQQSSASSFLYSLAFGQKVRWAISEMPPVKINGQIVKLSSCLLLVVVVGLCVLSAPSPRQEARQCLIIESERMGKREGRRQRRRLQGEGKREGRDREGVMASGDTSLCQTHRNTAAIDSSSQPRLQAQLDTGNKWTEEEEWRADRRGTMRGEGKRQIGHNSWTNLAKSFCLGRVNCRSKPGHCKNTNISTWWNVS